MEGLVVFDPDSSLDESNRPKGCPNPLKFDVPKSSRYERNRESDPAEYARRAFAKSRSLFATTDFFFRAMNEHEVAALRTADCQAVLHSGP